ncbi:hypothetical protein DES52_11275 [Deinococcus yavapaiensis KR-236]|uniref:Ion channel n=2 Tax=Deinococcus TaxID=1298 RepID=A0A318SFH9_9DEIO|nr:hypothetical protein DES52_11275 [Deinococcus yavapaiensis KR-236]
MLVTMGSDYFPRTAEGRASAWLLALYGFAVFGWITASVASFFVGRDQPTNETDETTSVTNEALLNELTRLRAAVLPTAPEDDEMP